MSITNRCVNISKIADMSIRVVWGTMHHLMRIEMTSGCYATIPEVSFVMNMETMKSGL